MWILKMIIGAFCVFFCIIGILWVIPAMIMWNSKPVDAFYAGVWETYEKFFNE